MRPHVLIYRTADRHWFRLYLERRVQALAVGRYCLSASWR